MRLSLLKACLLAVPSVTLWTQAANGIISRLSLEEARAKVSQLEQIVKATIDNAPVVPPRGPFEKTVDYEARKEQAATDTRASTDQPRLTIAELKRQFFVKNGSRSEFRNYDADSESLVSLINDEECVFDVNPNLARQMHAFWSRVVIVERYNSASDNPPSSGQKVAKSGPICSPTERILAFESNVLIGTKKCASGVYAIGARVSAPVVLAKVEPEFSAEANRTKFPGGKVVLYVEVNEKGQTQNIRVIQPLGHGLDEKAVEAVSQWRFRPGLRNGKPVTVAATIECNFKRL